MARIPVLGYARLAGESLAPSEPDVIDPKRVIVGQEDLTLDGEPFPWATLGDWVLTFPPKGIATLTVQIAVTIPSATDAPAGEAQ
jgi:hypothetical protein